MFCTMHGALVELAPDARVGAAIGTILLIVGTSTVIDAAVVCLGRESEVQLRRMQCICNCAHCMIGALPDKAHWVSFLVSTMDSHGN